MKKLISLLLTLLLIVSTFAACSDGDAGKEKKNGLKIVTTMFPVYDWVRCIAGDGENITYLDESGIDFHSYEPTAKDILALSEADMFIYIGGVSDKWVDNAVASSKNSDLIMLPLLDKVQALEEETAEGMQTHEETDSDELDEHIWLSLKNAKKAVEAITEAMCEADAENAEKYKTNSVSYISKLEKLDVDFSAAVSSSKRKTLLFADRFPFRYFTEDYGIEYYAAFSCCSAESEASFETVTFLMTKMKELNLPCAIILESSDGKLAVAVTEPTGAKTLRVNSCQSINGEDIKNGATYISIMEENIKKFTEALN